jgi:hypothetical protein
MTSTLTGSGSVTVEADEMLNLLALYPEVPQSIIVE